MTTIIFLSRNRIAKIALITIVIVSTLSVFKTPIINHANKAVQVLVGNKKLKPIYYVDTKDKKIAISFDATWGAEYTPKLLEILNKYNVKSTFFLTNIWLKDYPDVAKTIRLAGHEIGMHSVSHPHMNNLSEEMIIKELNDNAQLIKQITSFEPLLFRPPFGEYNNNLIINCKKLGFIPIQWSVDSLDWKESFSKEDIVQKVTKKIHPGAIVLFHNNGRYTADALVDILEYVFAKGYEVIPVSHLIYKENYYIDHAGAQKLLKK